MGNIFEKLLLINEIISEEELEYYKKIQSQSSEKRHIGDILLEKGLIDEKTLAQLQRAKKQSENQARVVRKQKKDKKVLEVIQKLGIVRQEELAACIRERHRAEARGQQVFLADLLIAKGYLTAYLVRKFYRKGGKRVALPRGVKRHEDLIINIPRYLKDRFLGKIALKNKVLTQTQLAKCWQSLKKHWPRKNMAQVMLDKNAIDEKKVSVLLEVLKQSMPERYPYFHAHIRDTKLARLLVKRNFLSPWRMNKSLLKQWKMIRAKDYRPIRTLLTENGYLTAYQFDVVLKKYGELVSTEMPSLFLMPPDELGFAFEDEEVEEEDGFEEIEEIEDMEELVNIEEIEAGRQERREESDHMPPLPKISTGFWKNLEKQPKQKNDEDKWKELEEISPLAIEDLDMDCEDEIEAEAIEVCEDTFDDLDFDMAKMLEEVAKDAVEYFPDESPRKIERTQKKKKPDNLQENG